MFQNMRKLTSVDRLGTDGGGWIELMNEVGRGSRQRPKQNVSCMSVLFGLESEHCQRYSSVLREGRKVFSKLGMSPHSRMRMGGGGQSMQEASWAQQLPPPLKQGHSELGRERASNLKWTMQQQCPEVNRMWAIQCWCLSKSYPTSGGTGRPSSE